MKLKGSKGDACLRSVVMVGGRLAATKGIQAGIGIPFSDGRDGNNSRLVPSLNRGNFLGGNGGRYADP
ncbi:hypothetical protein L3X38_012539 [Prunus dulcis]|uniref:Uncharacterized protein n=1 Tax=Prunus dulcis TaxID=3755 RepID=A0AAD4ZFB5_PRUDU|nr:hypothetical protein L3X38_012539 [Prunus dulcis]